MTETHLPITYLITDPEEQRLLTAALTDTHVEDVWAGLLILADYLEERGERRGPGYRWLATKRLMPALANASCVSGINPFGKVPSWDWWLEGVSPLPAHGKNPHLAYDRDDCCVHAELPAVVWGRLASVARYCGLYETGRGALYSEGVWKNFPIWSMTESYAEASQFELSIRLAVGTLALFVQDGVIDLANPPG